jgi:hypothetical protein
MHVNPTAAIRGRCNGCLIRRLTLASALAFASLAALVVADVVGLV